MEELQSADVTKAIGPVDDSLVVALDELVGAAVGVTTVALAQTELGQDLTLPQWRALVVISSSASGLRASEIAVRIGMSRPSMTRLLQRLVRRGLVVIESDPSDGRATILRPTEAGVALRVATMSRRRRLIVEALGARTRPLAPNLAGDLEIIAESLDRYA